MTSEGQHAGQQPGAMSGGGADPFGPDGFPPDPDGRQAADRGPSYPHAQESFPSAYGPPPHATPNGGSPFVVPAVPPAGQTPPPGSPAPQMPGPTFGPGAAKFSSSGSARVPEPGQLPQRPPAAPPAGGAFPPPESAWAPPPAPPSAAPEDNPFVPRVAEPHPYGGGAGDLPQRSPGIAGGPLDGPVGDFNGFTPARKPAEAAPAPAPFDRPGTYGTPQPGATFGSAAPQQPFGSARPDDADGQSGRAPGVSAFGDQRIRVPGATLTGLPDAAPADGLPPRDADEGGALPTRGGAARGPDSGGFPLRGGTGSGSFPIRGGPESGSVGYAAPADGTFTDGSDAFAARRDSGAFAARGDSGAYAAGSDNSAFAARSDSGSYAAGSDNSAFAARSDSGSFAARGDSGAFAAGSDSGGFAARGQFGEAGPSAQRGDADGNPFGSSGGAPGYGNQGSPDSGGFPVRGAYDGPGHDGQPAPGLSARRPFGDRPGEPDQSAPFEGGASAYPQRVPGASYSVAGSPDLGQPEAASGGYAQRVPGASFGSGGAPVVAEPRSAASVPLPRDPAERLESAAEPPAEHPGPAKGTARPVSASASVPVASRVAPPQEAEELPPPQANPQSRVYGRPAPAEEAPAAPQHPYRDADHPYRDDEHSSGGTYGTTPGSGAFRAAPTSGAMGAATTTSGAYQQTPESLYAPPAESPAARPDGTYGRPAEAPFGAGPPEERPPLGGPAPADQFATRPSPDAFGAAPVSPYDGRPGTPDTGGAFGAAPVSPYDGRPGTPDTGAFGAAPAPGSDQPPERPAARATASARVSPPVQPFSPPPPAEQPDERGQQQFSEFTTDIAGRGQAVPAPGSPAARTAPQEQYGEHTTDVAGRNQTPGQPYVPAPALPTMHAAPPLENGFPPAPAPDSTQPFGERPRMGGVFPGPASRATVAPPDPEQTANWPSRPAPGEPDQGRFDSFRPDAPDPAPAEAAKPDTPHVRMLPVILGVILGAGLLVGLTLGITWLIARGSHDGDTGGSGFSVKAGDCVKREGNAAVTANCTDAGAFEVTAVVDAKEKCPDPAQPYVVNPTASGSQVLCLKPRA
ncbi:hypothetical protein ACIBSW_37040 [Actinoplanes sp. NPDC049668]|uniref:LppU/SCO3897 family protein n=1 Tax=unclassified Actinoplanes TaxID=2626549 RepID=UPI0033B2211C